MYTIDYVKGAKVFTDHTRSALVPLELALAQVWGVVLVLEIFIQRDV